MSVFGFPYGDYPKTPEEKSAMAKFPLGRKVWHSILKRGGKVVGYVTHMPGSATGKPYVKLLVEQDISMQRAEWDIRNTSLIGAQPLGLGELLKQKLDSFDADKLKEAASEQQSLRGNGAKWDGGKPMFDLLEDDCPLAVLGIVQVMTWAVEVKKYVPGSWQTVPEAIKRYGAALRRHQNAKARGERYDKESGLLHDFHIATNAVFVAELEARVDKVKGLQQQYNKTLPKA